MRDGARQTRRQAVARRMVEKFVHLATRSEVRPAIAIMLLAEVVATTGVGKEESTGAGAEGTHQQQP